MDVEKHAPFTKSPLDPWRGTGQVAKRMGLPVPFEPANRLMTTGLPETAIDIAGNEVRLDHDYIQHIATIKTTATMIGASGMGHLPPENHIITAPTPHPVGMPKMGRAPSPCPCRSKECMEEYEKTSAEFAKIIEAFKRDSDRLVAEAEARQKRINGEARVRDA